MNLKLGRKHPTRSKLSLHKYLGKALPPPPPAVDWTLAVSTDYGMMLNDKLGCCVASGLGHACQIISANGDGLVTPTDDEILRMYEAIGGYQPGDASTDNGANEVDGMKYLHDIGLAGVKLDAFADVDHRNIDAVKQAISLFGGVYIGVMLPRSAMQAFEQGQPWDDTSDQDILGGHALYVPAYQVSFGVAITWGKAQPFSWDWFKMYCDEAHCLLMFPWVRNSVNTDPDGLDLAALEEDLKLL